MTVTMVHVYSGADYYKYPRRVTDTMVKKQFKPSVVKATYVYDRAVKPIRLFKGEHGFLSNFWYCDVHMYGLVFRSSEHAFMYHKSDDIDYRTAILEAATPNDAKKLGRKVKLRPDWNTARFIAMYTVLLRKFSHNVELGRKLQQTGWAFLEEGNTWNDTFWGTCNGEGSNYLGRLLMAVRYKLYTI